MAKEFPKSLSDKYDIKKTLKPTKTSFGSNHKDATIDLGNEDALAAVEAFCKKYPDQQYFIAKGAAKATPVPART